MKTYLHRAHSYLTRLNAFRLIFLFIVVNAFNSFIFSKIAYFITGERLKNTIDDSNGMNQFLIVVFVAPIIETLIFQYAIIETVRKKMAPIFVCLCSALAFASVHFYSLYYFLYALISGLIFAYLYFIGKSVMNSCVMVLTTHMLYNLLIYIGRSF